jgi:hypothetical protein
MSAHLLIHDSSPPHWWVSPDIWVVPGTDPNGPPGSPIAGQPAYLWARVSNIGNVAANGTRVDFYWADPSGQMVVGVATQIGSAFVDLNPSGTPGDIQEALCLVPWIPVIVNLGHECVLAVAHGAGDTNPIPDPLPKGFPFDPPAHDQIAQLNLSVLEAGLRLIAPLSISVAAIGRVDKQAHLAVEFGHAVDERVLAQLGLHDVRPAQKNVVNVALSREPRCDEHPDPHGQHELEAHVPRGTAVPVFVAIHAKHLGHKEYQLVHIVERVAGKVVGGVSYIVVNRHQQEQQS